MLKFKNLKYKNFLSTGNQFTQIQLDKSNSTLIIGSNGAGKSTMLDALTFVLFNKPFRKINKNQLINTANEKDCVVEVDFSIGTDNWKVSRGIKPSYFNIYKNDVLLDQEASSNDQQKWLEQNVLKLNYKSFTQIVVLGSSNFVPFMQLSSQHRREVVEDLLDIKVFSSMNDVAKGKIRELRDQIKELGYKKDNLEDKLDSQKTLIEEIEKMRENDIKERKTKIDVIDVDIDTLNIQNTLNQKTIGELTDKIKDLSFSEDKLRKLENLNIKIDQKINSIIEDHKFFEDNDVCPTCTQKIDNKLKDDKIKSIQKKRKEIEDGRNELQKSINEERERQNEFIKINKDLLDLNQNVNLNNVKISQFRKQIKEIESEVQKLTTQSKNGVAEVGKLEEIKSSLNEILELAAERKEDLSNCEFVHMLLKDDGAKTKIIKKYLPAINYNLNKYLELLEFSVNFTLDEEFNEKALNPIYEDFSYESFSEGEKMRIDLAILFTWREIAKMKNSINTNLLILDEVFDSSLDDSGTDYFTRIIKFVIEKSNVFVISHKKEDLLDKFDSTIVFEKRSGFSVMVDH